MLKLIKTRAQEFINQSLTPFNLILIVLLGVLSSCSSSKINQTLKQTNSKLSSSFYDHQFTGVVIVDAEQKDTLIAINKDRYFTPASNVKIFTLYSGLKILPQNIPTLKYVVQNDTLFFEGTADPTWLHPYFNDSTAIQFLRGFKNLAFSTVNFQDTKFAPGWAWEDYAYYFSPERGAQPLYGNVLTISEAKNLRIRPNYFKDSIIRGKTNYRAIDTNDFSIPEKLSDTLEIPFKTSYRLTKNLLQEKLKANLTLVAQMPSGDKKTLSGIATDSIYKRMMLVSDNFLAEQLMLNAASTLSDTLSFKIAKDYILKNHLSILKQEPRWVDGSGLSRYNLFTPESFLQILTLLKNEVDEKRLFHLFPSWNANGTIQKIDNTNEIPFIYAKSGGMGNVYNLSGYLKTKSGKVLIFSFMNNHFRKPSGEIRQHIYDILKSIHEVY